MTYDNTWVWESHTDLASSRLTKPNHDLIYPAYVVGEADHNTETTRVAEVTGQNSDSHQLVDLLRPLLNIPERPAPGSELPEVEKLLQQLVREPQSRKRCCFPSSTVNAGDSGHLRNSDRSGGTGRTRCVSPVGRWVMQRHVRILTSLFRFCSQDGGRKRRRGVSL